MPDEVKPELHNTLPNTGVFVVQGGVWVDHSDPTIIDGGEWKSAYAVDIVDSGAWKQLYLREIPVTLAITSPPPDDLIAGIDQNSDTITGTALDELGRAVVGNLSVERLLIKDSGTTTEDRGTVTVQGDGSWSFTYDEGVADPTLVNADQQWRFSFAENNPFQAATVLSYGRRVNSSAVALTITSQPSGNVDLGYDTWTESGTAFREDASVAPGTVYTSWSIDNGTWSTEQSATVDASGNWTTGTQGPFGGAGQRRLRVRYEPLPGGYEDPITVFGNTVTAVPRATTFSKGTVGETSIAMSCPSRNNVSGYQFYEGGTQRQSGSSRSYTRSSLSNYGTYYNFKVRTYATSAAGTTYYSAFSTEHDARTGRPEKRDSGSKNFTISPWATNSWRSEQGWGQVGDIVAQGTFGTYSSYRGVIDFGSSNAVRDIVRQQTGSTSRQQNGTCTLARVWLYRRGSTGFDRTVTVRFHRASSAVNGSVGSATHMKDTTSTGWWVGGWYDLGTSLGQLLGDGDQNTTQSRSIQIRHDGTGHYAHFNGRSSGTLDCRLNLTWSWNIVTQTKQNGTWLN